MFVPLRTVSLIAFIVLALAACERGTEDAAAPARPAEPVQVQEPPADAALEQPVSFTGLTMTAPADWTRETPGGAMRLVQLRVPGVGDAGEAQLVIFHLGPTGGGTVEANIERWRGQFSGPDGEPVEPAVTTAEANGVTLTTVELAGVYSGGMMAGGAGPEPDRMMIQTIAEGPHGKAFIRLLGPSRTVAANRNAFFAMLETVRVEP